MGYFLLGAYRKVTKGESNGNIADDITRPYDIIVVMHNAAHVFCCLLACCFVILLFIW